MCYVDQCVWIGRRLRRLDVCGLVGEYTGWRLVVHRVGCTLDWHRVRCVWIGRRLHVMGCVWIGSVQVALNGVGSVQGGVYVG